MTFRVECGSCYWRTSETTVRVGSDIAGNATSPDKVTIDEVFDAIDEWLRGGPLSRYEAIFDAQFGYPIFISIDGDDDTYDDEWVFFLESFKPVDSN